MKWIEIEKMICNGHTRDIQERMEKRAKESTESDVDVDFQTIRNTASLRTMLTEFVQADPFYRHMARYLIYIFQEPLREKFKSDVALADLTEDEFVETLLCRVCEEIRNGGKQLQELLTGMAMLSFAENGCRCGTEIYTTGSKKNLPKQVYGSLDGSVKWSFAQLKEKLFRAELYEDGRNLNAVTRDFLMIAVGLGMEPRVVDRFLKKVIRRDGLVLWKKDELFLSLAFYMCSDPKERFNYIQKVRKQYEDCKNDTRGSTFSYPNISSKDVLNDMEKRIADIEHHTDDQLFQTFLNDFYWMVQQRQHRRHTKYKVFDGMRSTVERRLKFISLEERLEEIIPEQEAKPFCEVKVESQEEYVVCENKSETKGIVDKHQQWTTEYSIPKLKKITNYKGTTIKKNPGAAERFTMTLRIYTTGNSQDVVIPCGTEFVLQGVNNSPVYVCKKGYHVLVEDSDSEQKEPVLQEKTDEANAADRELDKLKEEAVSAAIYLERGSRIVFAQRQRAPETKLNKEELREMAVLLKPVLNNHVLTSTKLSNIANHSDTDPLLRHQILTMAFLEAAVAIGKRTEMKEDEETREDEDSDIYGNMILMMDDVLLDCGMEPLYLPNPYDCFLAYLLTYQYPLEEYEYLLAVYSKYGSEK